VKLPFKKDQDRVVALDVGSRLVKVVEMSRGDQSPRLLRYGLAHLSPDTVVEGEIMDRDLLLEGINQAFSSAAIGKGRVVSCISSRSVINKRLLMDQMDPEDARGLIEAEAASHIPFDVEDVCLDFQILEPDAGNGKMEILLVAAKREVVYEHLALLRDAGLKTNLVDVDSFAVQNLHESFGSENSLATLVNVGAEVTNVNIVRDGFPLFTRDFAVGCGSYIEALQRDLQISYEDALDLVNSTGQTDNQEKAGETAVRDLAEEIAVGLERSLAYLRSTGELEDLGTVRLSGGGGNLSVLKRTLEDRLHLPVETVDPLSVLTVEKELAQKIRDGGVATLLSVAVGLGMREVGS
jgi:type IV pilus assembly protein PilM